MIASVQKLIDANVSTLPIEDNAEFAELQTRYNTTDVNVIFEQLRVERINEIRGHLKSLLNRQPQQQHVENVTGQASDAMDVDVRPQEEVKKTKEWSRMAKQILMDIGKHKHGSLLRTYKHSTYENLNLERIQIMVEKDEIKNLNRLNACLVQMCLEIGWIAAAKVEVDGAKEMLTFIDQQFVEYRKSLK